MITVLMAVHDGEKHIREAIESVLRQTLGHFEFLIIDDGSVDRTSEIVRRFDDRRIRLLVNERNIGLASSLNQGLDLAKGEYVARMDSDDVCRPERLERQRAWLRLHPSVGACGSWVRNIGGEGRRIVRYYDDPRMVKASLPFDPPMAHPSVMLRREYFDRHGLRYDTSFLRAQDYDLWERASHCFPISNVPEVLLDYRVASSSDNGTVNREKQRDADRVRIRQLHALEIRPSEEEIEVHGIVSQPEFRKPTIECLPRIERWLIRLKEANARTRAFPEPQFPRILGARWLHSCMIASGRETVALRVFLGSPLRKLATSDWRRLSVLGLQRLIRR